MIERGEKVYGGNAFNSEGHQVRAIVVARTQKEAAAIVGTGLHDFRNYRSETGN